MMKKLIIPIFFALIFVLSCKKEDNQIYTTSPTQLLDNVWTDFDETYPYFTHKKIDWDSVYTVYSSKISDSSSAGEIFDIIGEMTLTLRDIHVNFSSPYGYYQYSKKNNYPENPPGNALNYLADIYMENSISMFGKIENTNYAYLRVSSLSGNSPEYSRAASALDSLNNNDALIIDIRSNGGGNETNGRTIAGRFVSTDTHYKYSRVRTGAGWDDFSSWNMSYFKANDFLNFSKPVVLLTNRRVYSSAELFALMLKTNPNLIIVGDTTGGASANPAKRTMSNGWQYRVSTWQAASLDYTLIEDNGIAPDHYVIMDENSINDGRDLILEKAIEVLNTLTTD